MNLELAVVIYPYVISSEIETHIHCIQLCTGTNSHLNWPRNLTWLKAHSIPEPLTQQNHSPYRLMRGWLVGWFVGWKQRQPDEQTKLYIDRTCSILLIRTW